MDLSEVTSILTRTPTVLATLLADLPSPWLHRDDGPGTWSAYAIVGHLVHAEAVDWMPRARMILAHGSERPFEPFDPEAMLTWTPEPAARLLARLAAARAASLEELASLGLTPDDLERRGRHPELGEVTLGQLLATWAAHDLIHLGQIGEVLARRYREDVGPWRALLPALERTAEAE